MSFKQSKNKIMNKFRKIWKKLKIQKLDQMKMKEWINLLLNNMNVK